MDDVHAQIARLKAETARQEIELADLEAEVLDLEQELDEFAHEYDRIVQPMVTRLDIIKDAIAELEELKEPPPPQLGSDPNPLPTTWTPPPGYVPVEEQFRRAWQKPTQETPSPPPSPSGWTPPSDYVPVEEQFRRAWQRPPKKSESPSVAGVTPGAAGSVSKAELKRLYRQLARRYHPDLSTDPRERERRNRLMAEINEAYTQRDVDALQALMAQPEDIAIDEPLAAMQLRQLQQVREQLDRRVAHLQQVRDELFNGDLMWLKVRASLVAKKGRNLLQEMADEMEHEYAACLARLDELRGL